MKARRNLVVGILLVAVLSVVMACDVVDEINRMFFPDPDEQYRGYETEISSSPTTLTKAPWRSELDIQNPEKDRLLIKARTPGPPFPSYATITWTSAKWGDMMDNVKASHSQYQTVNEKDDLGLYRVQWKLPVNTTTGETEQVEISYDFHSDSLERLDSFTVQSDQDQEPETRTIFRKPPTSGRQASTDRSLPSWPAAPRAGAYELWEVWISHQPSSDLTLTANRCEDWKGVLQNGRAFMALRFPVALPSVVATQVYTMPISFSKAFSPTLSLVNTDTFATLLSVPLEYKPAYLGFMENELPEAPGEHWLSLGAVITPTIDCSALPDVPEWWFETSFYMDLGGGTDPPELPLPLYYCFEGSEGPLLKNALDTGGEIYQGWDITCLGPQQVSIHSYQTAPLALQPSNSAWITSTQTISFSHSVRNRTPLTITVSVGYTSSLGLDWGIYSGAEDAPDWPLIALPDSFFLPPYETRDFWAIASVPVSAGSAMGSEVLMLTAMDINQPAHRSWATDLLWLGEWANPPPLTLQRYIFMPIIIKIP